MERPKTFAIQAENRKLIEAIWEDLLKVGYRNIDGLTIYDKPDSICIATNPITVANNSQEDFSKLTPNVMGYIPDDYDVQFNLPQDYVKALAFAKEQLDHPYWKKGKYGIGDWIITEGYCDQYDGKALKILDNHDVEYHHFYPSEKPNHNFHRSQIKRKAIYDEVVDSLIQEARNKYRKDDVVKCLSTGKEYLLPETILFEVSPVYSVFVSQIVLYTEKEGWAEVVKRAEEELKKPTFKVVKGKDFTMIHTWGGEFLGLISNSIIDRMDRIVKEI